METTSFKFHFRPSRIKGRKQGKLFIRVIRQRKTKQLTTPYALYPEEWDEKQQKVILPDHIPGNDVRLIYLSQIAASVNRDLVCLGEVIEGFNKQRDYTATDVIKQYLASTDQMTVSGYAGKVAQKLYDLGADRLARAYCSAARSLNKFCGKGRVVLLSDINASLMKGFEIHLQERGLKLNTISFYMRNIRALYHRAIREKLIIAKPENPFAAVFTGVDRTRHRALSLEQLNMIARLEKELSRKLKSSGKQESEGCKSRLSELQKALFYFMFCYHARGMSFIDMVYLKKQDLQNGVLTYKRRKTGGLLEVRITKPMKRILTYFRGMTKGSEYAFPLIDTYKGNIRLQYESALKKQNSLLKALASAAGINVRLSTHVARHTWATLAKRMNTPIAIISEALGHRDLKTTCIYLASFERSTMDKLSEKLSAAVRFT